MISIRNLTIQAGAHNIVDSFSTGMPDRCLTAVIGPSGAGKSTLLKAMCGELSFDGGDIVVEGLSVRHWPRRKLELRRAVMPQECALNFPMTAREVAAIGRIFRERWCLPGRNDAVIQGSLELAGVAHLAHRLYPTLSGGEQRRVQFARALARILDADQDQPRYLWLDEPTRGLDLAHQHHVLQVARLIARAGGCVVSILHDLNLATAYADRVILMSEGKLAAAGEPEECLRPEVVERVFGIGVLQATHPALDKPMLFGVPQPLRGGSWAWL